MDNEKTIFLTISSRKFVLCGLLALLAGILCYVYGSSKAGIILAGAFLIVGAIHLKKETIDERWMKKLYGAVLCILCAFMMVFICQRVLNESVFSIGSLRIVLNMCVCLIVTFFLFFITVRLRTSLVLSSFVLVFLSTVNHYVFLFRGSELAPSDVLSVGTAANVAARYKVIPNAPIIYAWLLLILSWCVIFTLPDIRADRKVLLRISSVMLMIILIGAIGIGSREIEIYHFMQVGSVLNGYLLNFCLQIPEIIIKKPEGYDPLTITARETAYTEVRVDGELPDIFVVMDESYADLSVLGDKLRTNKEVSPFISSLSEDVIKGYALSSIFGGGTPDSEYEFLSGNSLMFLPPGAIVYQQYLNEPAHTMIVDLKGIGYKCIAMHPFFSNGWERENVYPRLGFDEAYYLEDFPQKDLQREFVSDREAFEEMLRRYKGFKAESDQNTFMFLVTMQNHGDYEYTGDDFEQTIDLEGYAREYPDVEQYLTLVHETDSAVEWLINQMRLQDSPAVVVFYGDHLPRIDDRIFEEIHGGPFATLDEQQLQKTVPFFVWANYDIEEETVGLTSLNYLSNYMYEAAGMELPAYNQYLASINKELPCMNSAGYYSKEAGCFKTYEEAEGEEAARLNEYHQFVYNCMFDKEERNNYFFPLPAKK